ncbi:MAG: hypothetical protein ACD_20C00100G0001 [uncultured bacterium]|nr:MAG: hypothetical protein ACD_20C00100G0001 [uncultured bacterium]HBH18507.1 hypothetical protein [Cyanobacteria bacterium UBA9579]
MHKIKLKGFILPIIILILGVVITSVTALIPIPLVNTEIPLLIIGAFTVFSSINFLIFKKATAVQVLVLAVIATLLFTIITSASLLFLDIIGVKKIVLSSSININVFLIIINLLTSTLFISSLIKFEEIKITKISKNTTIQHIESQQKTYIKEEEPEIISITEEFSHVEKQSPPIQKNEEPEIKEIFPLNQAEPVQEEFFLEDALPSENITATLENKQEIFIEETFSLNLQEENNQQYSENIFDSNLGELPEISLTENLTETKPENVPVNGYDASIFDDDGYIPENIRLIEKSTAKKAADTAGQISSIGKLLVNQKDIENIIELNESSYSENDSDNSNIIPKELGEKLKESLSQIQKAFPEIKNSTISNKAGFTIASLINNTSTEQTVGALASGAFMALQNYLSRLSVGQTTKIFFETETNIHILTKIENLIFYFNCSKQFEPVIYSLLRDTIDQNVFSNQDLSVIKNVKGIIEAAITDKDGNLTGSINSENPQKLASISSAIFENLKVFISNIEPAKLSKMIIFSNEKILTIKKYNDAIASLITTIEGPITLSEKITKIEELIN